jgi:tetratricopeptide (TPR) repeat protein
MGFVGRDRELTELLAGVEDASRGRGRVFLLVGEPGIGKTALAEQLGERAAALGARSLWARAWEGGGAPPYWLWAQILRQLATNDDAETVGAPAARAAPHLGTPEPDPGLSAGAVQLSSGSHDADRQQFELFDSVARFLQGVSSSQPLVILLDDVLAGDQASQRLLRFMVREVQRAHVLIVATCRDTEVSGRSDGAELLAAVVRDGHVLRPTGLDRDEVRTLITNVAGVVPSAGCVAAIHEATAGNPLFVREVTRLLSAEAPLDRPGRPAITIPPSAQALIRQRLSPLSADTILVLSAGAVVGREFGINLVQAACGLPRDRIVASLAEALATGIVTEGRETITAYSFSHPLIREVIYEDVPLPARSQMHRQIGGAIERVHGTEAGMFLSDLALHFSRAAATGDDNDAARALDYARRAGDRALTAWAYEEASTMYRWALDALEHTGGDKARRCDLLLRLGLAQARVARYDDAAERFLEAAEIARELGAHESLARAALGLGERQVEGGVVDRRLVGLLDEALAKLSPHATPLRARLMARFSAELTFSAETCRQEMLSREAVAVARQSGDAGALVSALDASWMAAWGPDGLSEREALTGDLIALAAETGDPGIELSARAKRITCALEFGDIRSVDHEIAAHARLAAEYRMPFHEWTAATIRTMRTLLHGSIDMADQLAHAALSIHPHRANARTAWLDQFTFIRWEQRRLGELHDRLEQVATEAPHATFGLGWLCLANAELGRVDEARSVLHAAVDRILELPRNGIWLQAIAPGAIAVSELEDADTAAVLYPLLLPYARLSIALPMPHPVVCYGSASLYLGLLASTLSRWDEAEAHFEAASHANERLGALAFLARTRCEHARMLLRRGRPQDRGRALDLLARAAATASAFRLASIGERAATAIASAESLPCPARNDARPTDVDDDAWKADSGADVFRREGDYWTVMHDGAVVRVRDSKGLRCLARLLARPGHEILAVDLEASERDTRSIEAGSAHSSGADEGCGDTTRRDLGHAGAWLDAQAKAAYKARLDELRSEREEAESFNDPVRAATASEEIDCLTNELARAVGLGGRDREAASHSERARLNVTRAIRSAMKNLAKVHPSLAEHLSLTIRTGRFCCYAPDPRVPIRWET